MREIHIVAHIDLKPGYKKEIMPVLEELVTGSRAESGNISYTLTENLKNPEQLTVIEHWASREAITAHNASAHFRKFVQALEGKAERIEIIELAEIL